MNILVSGVGSDIGFGVGRILKEWGIFRTLYGIDVSNDHPASIIFDKIDVAPHSNNQDYINWILKYITFNKIDVFIPTSELEILKVSRNIEKLNFKCKVLINHSLIIEKCIDKYETLNFLSLNGIQVPNNGLVNENKLPKKFPVIVKPRISQGSKGVKKIENISILKKVLDESVWQEYLLPEDEEYTCSVYVTKGLNARVLVIKRTLVCGYTEKGVVVNNHTINEYIDKILSVFKLPGLYNIQLRLTHQGPKLFEINPRLSGTLVFRDKLGFQDLRWWLSENLDLKLPKYKMVLDGKKIYRGSIEYIL